MFEPVERFEVRSAAGTAIAVWARTEGSRAVVLVHGSLSDHTTFDPLVACLGDMSTFALDRRGYGASADASDYAFERELEDVAAVVDAAAARTGRPVVLFGHSFGANCALFGACLTSQVERVVLYEPSLGLRYAEGSIEAIEAALARGDREAALCAVLIDVLELSAQDVDAMRAGPRWPVLLAGTHLVAREARVEHGFVYRKGQLAALKVPTLLLVGSETPGSLRDATERARAAITNASVRVLDGHAHLAHKSDPALIARCIRDAV